MKKYFLLSLFLFSTTLISAQQTGSVSGIAFDTISQQPITGVTVSVLSQKDSSLISFSMTDNDGKFSITHIPNGQYRVLMTHVQYHNSNVYFAITDEQKNINLSKIIMNDKTKVLDEVVVASEAPPVTLVGDTIQYNAGSFKTKPNANVENLLKKLPGVKVEKDGTVKAQGEKVTKVLVDGKSFFGNDPKIATKNLPADAVDKVQVFDKKSEMADMTGFDDGNTEKTINLKLKKSKKKGQFGKITVGAGNHKRFEGKFNINSFKGARQLSAIGMGNNTNAQGFSFFDILNFTGELARMQRGMSGGDININISLDDATASAMNLDGGRGGITKAWGGGINYNNIIGNKLDWQSNYFYNRLNPQKNSRILRQYILPDSTYFYNENAYTNTINNNHRVNLNTLYQIDSLNSIRIIPSFSYQKTNGFSQRDYQTLTAEQQLRNEGFSNAQSANEGYHFSNEILWRKKFRKPARTFSLQWQTSLNHSNGNGSLSSINKFYNPDGTIARIDSLNQINNQAGDLKSYNLRGVYTEPLWKRSLLELSAGNSNSKSTAQKETFDFNPNNQKYDRANSLLTNDFENKYSTTNAGIRLRTKRNSFYYAIGAMWQQAKLSGKIISNNQDSVIRKTFQHILPSANFRYSFTKFKSLSFNYSTTTNQPTIAQLQPVPDNSNPLNIRVGNPDLKQEYSHAFRLGVNIISPYKSQNLFVNIRYRITQNKIVNADNISTEGIKTTQPVNVNGVSNFNSDMSYSFPVRFVKGSLDLTAGTGIFKTQQFINGEKNHITTVSFQPDIRIYMNPTAKINLMLGAGFGFDKTKYSLQSTLNTKTITQSYSASADVELPKGFYVSTDFDYAVNTQRAQGFNTKVPLWNASISKQMLKFNRGELKFSVNDILNKNVGISRNTNQNYIEDASVLTLRRYFLLSFTFSLSKVGLQRSGGNGDVRIITR
ncbi:MAG: outer membrane beta-barrel protein [Chitinophagaceae bacterium]